MNILPKKNWHVRTSENIARVRRDEAKAAEEAKELERRSKLAEQEARTNLMRERARQKRIEAGTEDQTNTDQSVVVTDDSGSVMGRGGHVNFFQQLEDGEGAISTNKEHEEEKKKEQEEYEKKVGYLTYLGQDTEELTGEQVWWKKKPQDRLVMPESNKVKSAVNQKQKEFLDPLSDLRKYLKCDGVRLTIKKHEKKLEEVESKALNFESVKKKKRRRDNSSSSSSSRSRSRERRKRKKKKGRDENRRVKKRHRSSSERHSKTSKKDRKRKSRRRRASSSSSSDSDSAKKSEARSNLEKMRKERLERERMEREKANRLVYGEPVAESKKDTPEENGKRQKYNSQFNPEFARQNKLDPNKKYWLQ